MRQMIHSAFLILLTLPVMLCVSGCKRKERPKVQPQLTQEESAPLAMVIHVADPRAAIQLLKGFYDIEQGSWRWTKGKFSVLLRIPENAAQKKVVLQMKFAVPDPVIKRLKSVTLSATVNGIALPPERYNQPGEYVFARDVPAKALGGDAATVDFALDKALAPGAVDTRELGIVAHTIGFEQK
jgi:hypothetical protein